jgi:hypothetical protein
MKMKKISKIALAVLSLVSITYADTVHLNYWSTGGGGNLRTSIDFTNICNEKIVNVDVKFWKIDGTLLSNTNINGQLTTNNDGVISLNINPKVTKTLHMDDAYFEESGHAEVSTYITGTSNVEYPQCIIGKVKVYSTKTDNPYDGLGTNYLIHNGNRF